jgi:YggT family protein
MSMSSLLLSIIQAVFWALYIVIMGRVIMSWIDPQGNMQVTRVIHEISEPLLGPIRRVLPNLGMIDLSPLVAILLIQFLQRLIVSALI